MSVPNVYKVALSKRLSELLKEIFIGQPRTTHHSDPKQKAWLILTYFRFLNNFK